MEKNLLKNYQKYFNRGDDPIVPPKEVLEDERSSNSIKLAILVASALGVDVQPRVKHLGGRQYAYLKGEDCNRILSKLIGGK